MRHVVLRAADGSILDLVSFLHPGVSVWSTDRLARHLVQCFGCFGLWRLSGGGHQRRLNELTISVQSCVGDVPYPAWFIYRRLLIKS